MELKESKSIKGEGGNQSDRSRLSTLVLWSNSANDDIVAVHTRNTYHTPTADQVVHKMYIDESLLIGARSSDDNE